MVDYTQFLRVYNILGSLKNLSLSILSIALYSRRLKTKHSPGVNQNRKHALR